MAGGPTISPFVENNEIQVIKGEFKSKLIQGDYLNVMVPESSLTDLALQALDLVPSWLKDDYVVNMSQLSEDDQNKMAQMLLNTSEPNYIDELAFLCAHVAPQLIHWRRFSTDLLVEQVQLIYEIADELNYVDIVEYGKAGVDEDFYTTLRYNILENGVPTTWELPKEYYYWYVVHPKISDEKPTYINPGTGTYSDPPEGVFWRSYYYYDEHPSKLYQTHYLQKHPNEITEDSLQNWNPSTLSYFTDFTIDPIVVVKDNISGEACLIDIKFHNGTIVASLMPVEWAYVNLNHPLLENLIEYGNGNTNLPQNARVALFRDVEQPYGTVNEQILQEHSRDYDVFTSDDIPNVDLSPYKKIIIAGNQPYSFYETISENREWFEQAIMDNKVLQINGETSSENSWAGLIMPGGFTCASFENSSNEVSFVGYPLLRDVITNALYLWDGESVALNGGRPFNSDIALDIIGNWVSKVVPYPARGNRPIQPNQIIYEHDGNCGELQDSLAAACRTLLIPTRCAMNIAWDHVWCEFWKDGWHPYQVDLGMGATRIDWPGCAYDKKYGGSKDLSAVWAWRNDGKAFTDTDIYSDTCTFSVSLFDSNNLPVDGARVELWVHYYNNPNYPLTLTTFDYTKPDGTLTLLLGDYRDFWMKIISPIGNIPPTGNDPIPIIENSEPGESYSWSGNLMDSIEAKIPESATMPPEPLNRYAFNINLNNLKVYYHGNNYYDNNYFNELTDRPQINVFICDEVNYSLYEEGKEFEAYYINLGVSELQLEAPLPYSDTWYLIVDNSNQLVSDKIFDFYVELKREGQTIDNFQSHQLLKASQSLIVYSPLEPYSWITYPEDGAIITDDILTIRGTAQDNLNVGLQKVQLSLDNGNTWIDVQGTDNWTYDWIEPPDGQYTLMARAIDNEDNIETPNPDNFVNITVDRSGPVVQITYPESDICQKLENVQFQGTAEDTSGVSKVEISPDNGNTWYTVEGTENWTYTFAPQNEGTYIFVARGIDTLGNVGELSNSVQVKVDLTPPTGEITDPKDGDVLTGEYYTIKGTATDNEGCGVKKVEITWDDGVHWVTAIGTDNWYYDWYLPESGSYSLYIRITDNVRNQSSLIGPVNITISKEKPVIYAVGYWDSYINNNGGQLKIYAFTSRDVVNVQIYYQNQPTGLFLTKVQTGLFYLDLDMPSSLPPQNILLSFIGQNSYGIKTNPANLLVVK